MLPNGEEDDAFRTWFGSVGESLVVATERDIATSVRQVSLISDRFGYDVESMRRRRRHRFEVKTSLVGTEHRVFLTRNEARSAARYAHEWFLVQVILTPEAVTLPRLTLNQVRTIRLLPGSSLIEVLPRDSEHCRWVDTVELATTGLSWTPYFFDSGILAQWQFKGAPR